METSWEIGVLSELRIIELWDALPPQSLRDAAISFARAIEAETAARCEAICNVAMTAYMNSRAVDGSDLALGAQSCRDALRDYAAAIRNARNQDATVVKS